MNNVIAGGNITVTPNTPTAGKTLVNIPVGADVPMSSSVTLEFKSAAGIVNPVTAGNYTAVLYTNEETAPVSSNAYAITSSTISGTTVSLTNYLTNQRAEYTFTFTDGCRRGSCRWRCGQGSIPDGDRYRFAGVARVSAAPATNHNITLNNGVTTVSVAAVAVSGLDVSLTLPAGFSVNSNTVVTAYFDDGMPTENWNMITNPSTASNTNQAWLWTTKEPTWVSAPTYATTTTTTVTNVAVTLSNTGNDLPSVYTVRFKLGAAGTINAASGHTIYMTFPTGTDTTALVTGDVKVNTLNPATRPDVAWPGPLDSASVGPDIREPNEHDGCDRRRRIGEGLQPADHRKQ